MFRLFSFPEIICPTPEFFIDKHLLRFLYFKYGIYKTKYGINLIK